jgi:hypothetical protein
MLHQQSQSSGLLGGTIQKDTNAANIKTVVAEDAVDAVGSTIDIDDHQTTSKKEPLWCSSWRAVFSGRCRTGGAGLQQIKINKVESKIRYRFKKKERLQLPHIERKKIVNKRAKHRQLACYLSSISFLTPEDDAETLNSNLQKRTVPWMQRPSEHEIEEDIYKAQHHHFYILRNAWQKIMHAKEHHVEVLWNEKDDNPLEPAHIGQLLVKIGTQIKNIESCLDEVAIANMIMRTTIRIAMATSHELYFSPLHIACIQGLPPNVISLLIEKQLPEDQLYLYESVVTANNKSGTIPLHCIVRCICDGGIPYNEGVEIIDLLCNKDITAIHSVDNDLNSPLDLAYIVLVRKERAMKMSSKEKFSSLASKTQIQMIRVLLMYLRRISINAYRRYKKQCEHDHYGARKRLKEQLYDDREEENKVSVGPMFNGVSTSFSESHSNVNSNPMEGTLRYICSDVFKDCPVLENESLREPFVNSGLKIKLS